MAIEASTSAGSTLVMLMLPALSVMVVPPEKPVTATLVTPMFRFSVSGWESSSRALTVMVAVREASAAKVTVAVWAGSLRLAQVMPVPVQAKV